MPNPPRRNHSAAPAPVAILALALLLTPTSGSRAQQASAQPSSETSLAEISEALQRIAAALEGQQQERELEILMKRIELSESRLQPLETRLRELRTERDSLASQRDFAERNLEGIVERAESADSGFTEDQRDTLIGQLEAEIEGLDEKLAAADREIAVLENQTARQRRDVEDWQAYVDRRIGDF